MSMFSINSSSGASLSGRDLFEFVKVYDYHVDESDAMLLNGFHVFGIGTNRENASRNHRVDRFYAAIEHFREARHFRDIANRNAFFPKQSRRTSGRNQFNAEFVKTPCEGGNTGLIGDTQERALDCRHGKGLFLHVLETLVERAALY